MGNGPNNGNSNNNNRRSVGNIINRVFESAGPDGKVRGTPQQIIDKYQALARDAQLAGDRVAAESFLQHSEHYSRMLGEATQVQNDMRPSFDRDEGPRDDMRRDDDRRDDDPRGEPYSDQPRNQQPRDQQARDQQPRDQQPRDQQARDQQPRDQQPRDQQPRDQQVREQQPRQQPPRDEPRFRAEPKPQPLPVIASSLTTIDTEDDGDFGGLIETPESGAVAAPLPIQTAAPEPQPEPEPAPNHAMNGASHPAVEDAAPSEPAKPKRGRPRKKAPAPEGETGPVVE